MKTRTKTKTRMRRKKTRKSFSLLVPFALLATILVGESAAGEKKAPSPYAMVAVTVFREPGLALPGAEVTLTPGAASGQALKAKKAICDARGEYVFRVSAQPGSYLVRAKAKGFHPEEKQVEVHGESERAEVTLELHAESKAESK